MTYKKPVKKRVRAYNRSGYVRKTKTGKVVHVRPHRVREHDQTYWVTEPVDLSYAISVFSGLPRRRQMADIRREAKEVLAPETPGSGKWLAHPERYDLLGVDTPHSYVADQLRAEWEAEERQKRGGLVIKGANPELVGSVIHDMKGHASVAFFKERGLAKNPWFSLRDVESKSTFITLPALLQLWVDGKVCVLDWDVVREDLLKALKKAKGDPDHLPPDAPPDVTWDMGDGRRRLIDFRMSDTLIGLRFLMKELGREFEEPGKKRRIFGLNRHRYGKLLKFLKAHPETTSADAFVALLPKPRRRGTDPWLSVDPALRDAIERDYTKALLQLWIDGKVSVSEWDPVRDKLLSVLRARKWVPERLPRDIDPELKPLTAKIDTRFGEFRELLPPDPDAKIVLKHGRGGG